MKRIKQLGFILIFLMISSVSNAVNCTFPDSANNAPEWVCDEKPRDLKEQELVMVGYGDSSITALINALENISRSYNNRVQQHQDAFKAESKKSQPDAKNIVSNSFGKMKLDSMLKNSLKLDKNYDELRSKVHVTRLTMKLPGCEVEIKLYKEKENERLRQSQKIEMNNCSMKQIVNELKKVNVRPVAYTVDPSTYEHYIAVAYQ